MDSENSRKQYEDLLLEAMEKIIRLAPRKSDQLKTEASKAAEIVQNEGPDERDANKYFFILKMALDIGSNKLRIQILSCIQKLISHGFLDGDCDDNCIYADGGRANHGNSKYARKLIDAIVESICN